MSRIYTVSFVDVAVSAAQDLFEITPAANRPVEIVGIELGQSSDSGDAQDEQLRIQIIRGHTTSGSGGTAPTPAPLAPSNAAAGFTAEVNNTTPATAGAGVTLAASAWNVRAGYINWFPEDARPTATAANTTIVVRQSAPADAITMSGTLYLRELG